MDDQRKKVSVVDLSEPGLDFSWFTAKDEASFVSCSSPPSSSAGEGGSDEPKQRSEITLEDELFPTNGQTDSGDDTIELGLGPPSTADSDTLTTVETDSNEEPLPVQPTIELRKAKSVENIVGGLQNKNAFGMSQRPWRTCVKQGQQQRLAKMTVAPKLVRQTLNGRITHSMDNFRSEIRRGEEICAYSEAMRLANAEWKLYVRIDKENRLGIFLVAKPLYCKKRTCTVKMVAQVTHPLLPFKKSIRRASRAVIFHLDPNHPHHSNCWGFGNLAKVDEIATRKEGFVDIGGKLNVQMEFTVIDISFSS